MISTVAIVGLTIAAITGVVSLALVLRFLWRVYDRGGRLDLTAAAKALREVHDPNWVAKLAQFAKRS